MTYSTLRRDSSDGRVVVAPNKLLETVEESSQSATKPLSYIHPNASTISTPSAISRSASDAFSLTSGPTLCSTCPTLRSQNSFQVSREDLSQCASSLRVLLKTIEDAGSVGGNNIECEVVQRTYRESLDTLQNILEPTQKKSSTLRRWLSMQRGR